MDCKTSIDITKELQAQIQAKDLYRPIQKDRFEIGEEITYQVSAVASSNQAQVRLRIERFVGGGFAGQVYRVRLLGIEPEDLMIPDLIPGKEYAMKILLPVSPFAKYFRNVIYWLGFQGPFQLQVNPFAVRAGALWQKFIRRGTKIYLGEESSVVDIYATFIDDHLGSCGELSEWVEGRTWRLEVDEYLDLLRRWRRGKPTSNQYLGSPEYRAKFQFMNRFVTLLHEMGAHEFARQYEWSTGKSQPNCLKRNNSEHNPDAGLTAVDFRAGLALLPFLPMSPGDIPLIFKGLLRGSLVQFDRGNLQKLQSFVEKHSEQFQDLRPAFRDLKHNEDVYRNSVPDITHHHVRLLYSRKLWSTIFNSAVTGWKVRNLIDEKWEQRLRGNKFLAGCFMLLGILPVIGGVLRKFWARPEWRRHYLGMLSSRQYLRRSLQAKIIEKVTRWHRSGRISDQRALNLAQKIWPCMIHLPLSFLPVGLHKFVTDWQYAKARLDFLFLRPIRLYFNAGLRAQWLRDMLEEGRKKHIVSDEDAKTISDQVDEPFIQKYLQSLAVHLCTLPVTQLVSLFVAIFYIITHPDLPRAQAYAVGVGILALFQVVPISPGSLLRGLYVVYLVIRERNFKDYNIAVFLGFFKYVGYLAFPIQMAYRYPAMARFMAGHWATEAVHFVPVFGERGALLEHWVFRLFYNWPLTIRRRMRNRAEARTRWQPRYWPIALFILVGTGIFLLADFFYFKQSAGQPALKQIWWLAILAPGGMGSLVTLLAGGASLSRRVISGALCGSGIAILHSLMTLILSIGDPVPGGELITNCLWKIFVFTIFSTLGVIITEVKLPDPKLAQT